MFYAEKKVPASTSLIPKRLLWHPHYLPTHVVVVVAKKPPRICTKFFPLAAAALSSWLNTSHLLSQPGCNHGRRRRRRRRYSVSRNARMMWIFSIEAYNINQHGNRAGKPFFASIAEFNSETDIIRVRPKSGVLWTELSLKWKSICKFSNNFNKFVISYTFFVSFENPDFTKLYFFISSIFHIFWVYIHYQEVNKTQT